MDDISIGLLYVFGALMGAIVSALLGVTLGKYRYQARLQVTEEKLFSKSQLLATCQERLQESHEKIDQLQDDTRDKDILIAELNVKVRMLHSTHEEQLAFSLGAKEQLTAEFQTVARKLFEEKNEKFTQNNRTTLTGVLSPLREQLMVFSKQVSDVYDKDLRDRISLQKEISELKIANVKISDEALNLTRALKGDNKVQGDWGEMILERVLEMSGLQKGREYSLQPSYKSQCGGAILRPDAVINLPSQKSVIVDSKVSLKHWELAVAAEDSESENEALKKHVESLRGHIKNLSGKQYEEIGALMSLDFVLMFVPIEAAFLKALQEDVELYGYASERNVLLVSPSTLLVTLKSIRYGWQNERQSKNAKIIAQRAGALHDQFVLFVDALEDVGDKISKAGLAYETAHKRLSSGKGNIVGRVLQLEELGAKTKRDLLLKESESMDEDQ
ncbi:hypothetical protein A9Q99_09620 [Gammaproteobacteria bacterium 45_16_T64]|nr:hypothetical protein A9Q99_09620 [Gammaproteobacteria bacterium 45_16_T64]